MGQDKDKSLIKSLSFRPGSTGHLEETKDKDSSKTITVVHGLMNDHYMNI